jgi:hypothetical protein
MGANPIHRQQLAAAIHHQDGGTAWPREAHCAVGKLYCGEEALSWHVRRLRGERRGLLRQRSIELRGKHLA